MIQWKKMPSPGNRRHDMNRRRSVVIIPLLALLMHIACISSPRAETDSLVYFDLGANLKETFRGTFIFTHEVKRFTRINAREYSEATSGDRSPGTSRLVIAAHQVDWINGKSGGKEEKWFTFMIPFRKGAQWPVKFRDWNQTYSVVDTDYRLKTPAGVFEHCVVIRITWVAHNGDVEGPQKKLIYLAPHLAVVKEQHFDNGKMWHEEVVTSFSRGKND
jgi:hypothetical protein